MQLRHAVLGCMLFLVLYYSEGFFVQIQKSLCDDRKIQRSSFEDRNSARQPLFRKRPLLKVTSSDYLWIDPMENPDLTTESILKGLSILSGPDNYANMICTIMDDFAAMGAKTTCLAAPHSFGYKVPKSMKIEAYQSYLTNRDDWILRQKFDVVHVMETPLCSDWCMMELQRRNTCIIYESTGSPTRFQDVQRQVPYAWTKQLSLNEARLWGQKSRLDWLQSVTHAYAYVAVEPDLFRYTNDLPSALPRPLFIPISYHPKAYVGCSGTEHVEGPLVLHAPSNPLIKGTKHVLDAVQSLKKKGIKFRFKLVTKISNDDAIKLYESSDLIIDQLHIGWYGTLALENMSLGKPVIVYIALDLQAVFDGFDMPVIPATIDNLEKVLENAIRDKILRERVSKAGRRWVEHQHSPNRTERQRALLYHRCMKHARS